MMDEADALARFLQELTPHGAGEIISSLMACVRDARRVTGRDVGNGQVVDSRRTGTWLGVAGYLTALDQVGTAVSIKGSAIPGDVTNGIERALRDFAPELDNADRKVIRSFRNALLHDFSLVDLKGSPVRRFTLWANPSEPMIKHPTEEWRGIGDERSETVTWVNIELIGNLVEGIVGRVSRHLEAGTLTSRLAPKELADRYTIGVSPMTNTP